jgi:alginate O-acetyltransferase complex protein AlgI
MLFNSFQFLIFFLIVTPIYFLLPHKFRWAHLLFASCVFYSVFIPTYIFILFFTIIIDYFAGILIENATYARKKKFLILSILANVLVLAIFKYYNFFIGNCNSILEPLHIEPLPYLSILLPIGLSFHTFQAMSYTIEVYRGNQRAERHFGIYALYVMFYPQLVAGPIERPQNMLHQFHEEKYFNFNNLYSGLRIILWGLFKKVVIADRLSIVADHVYNQPYDFNGFAILLATICFSFQIYCDFSGYSDMAIGLARIMGFDLMINFRQPYFSKSISEFWSRWHISLSTWFKDYLYIPMGGNRVNDNRYYFNLMVVFLISGFWHGANWTFIIWGILHGLYLVLGSISKKYAQGKYKLPSVFSILFTFLLVMMAWVFFRADSVENALYLISKILSINDLDSYFKLSDGIANISGSTFLGLPLYKLFFTFGLIGVLLLADWLMINYKNKFLLAPWYLQNSIYFSIILAILIFGVFDTKQFIYFQF